MDEQRQDDQLEPIYNNSMQIQDVALKTYQERWTIETRGGRWSGRSMLAVWHDDDDYKRDSLIFKHKMFWWVNMALESISLHPLVLIKVTLQPICDMNESC